MAVLIKVLVELDQVTLVACFLLQIPFVKHGGNTAHCLLLPLWLLHVNLHLSLTNKHFKLNCYGIQTNYVIMACYNAITELDPSDCLFKKQWEWEEVVRFHTPGWET